MKEYISSGFFVLRTPLLPFNDFLSLSEGLTCHCGNQPAMHDQRYEADRKMIRTRLQSLVQRPEVQEAIWLASPDLMESLSRWWSDPESEKGQRLEMAVYRYVARMTSRSTPFGLFAGCSVGRIGEGTRLEIG